MELLFHSLGVVILMFFYLANSTKFAWATKITELKTTSWCWSYFHICVIWEQRILLITCVVNMIRDLLKLMAF